MSDKTLGNARGLNSIADPRDFKGSPGRRRRREAQPDEGAAAPPAPAPAAAPIDLREAVPAGHDVPPTVEQPPPPAAPAPVAPHRAVTPGINRKRRELSVPHRVAEAVEHTGINAADVVMSAYRHHSDAVYAGAGGRMVARGRTRLRLSISDTEFEQLTRLGQARGWNRSETVSVLLALELLTPVQAADTD